MLQWNRRCSLRFYFSGLIEEKKRGKVWDLWFREKKKSPEPIALIHLCVIVFNVYIIVDGFHKFRETEGERRGFSRTAGSVYINTTIKHTNESPYPSSSPPPCSCRSQQQRIVFFIFRKGGVDSFPVLSTNFSTRLRRTRRDVSFAISNEYYTFLHYTQWTRAATAPDSIVREP